MKKKDKKVVEPIKMAKPKLKTWEFKVTKVKASGLGFEIQTSADGAKKLFAALNQPYNKVEMKEKK